MPNLSLAELEALDKAPKNDPPPPKPPITGGDGNKKAADLQDEINKQKNADNSDPNKGGGGSNDDPNKQPNPDETAEQKAARELQEANVAKGLNPDGSAKTPEQVAEEERVRKEEEELDAQDRAVWTEVDKLWGAPLEIKYEDPQGNPIHPNDPQGIFLRERAVADRAVEQFDAYLAEKDPRSYAYMLHRQAGGRDEDFFAQKTVTLPAYEVFKDSVDLRRNVYADSLRIKGIDEDQVKVLVDDAIAKKKLEALSDQAYKDVDKAQKDQVQALARQTQQQAEQFQRSVAALTKNINEEMSSGMRIVIPEAKKGEFGQFVRQHIVEDGEGGFAIMAPIDQKNLSSLLDMLYYYFGKGNLQELVTRQAQTQNVNRLRTSVDRSRKTPNPTSGSDGQNTRQKKTLGEL